MKKAGIYDPYLHILGGAERYILSIARCLTPEFQVVLYAEDKQIVKQAETKFGIKLKNIEVKSWEISRTKRRRELKSLDLFFYVTDGSLFISGAKKNILIIQSPDHIPPLTLLNRVKLLSWQKFICYSKFVARIVEKRLHKKANILFVPVTGELQATGKKENLILSVGRFFPHLHSKKQHEMVKIFRELVKEGLKDTILYLVGSIDPGADDYFKMVEDLARGLPVKIITDASYLELKDLYSRAKVYWHTTGFGEDLEMSPEKGEHFGVSTIEAMKHGAVPVTFSGGGQKEIVQHGHNGFLWNSVAELKKYTRDLLSDSNLHKRMSKQAQLSAKLYSPEIFCRELYAIIEN